MYMLKNYINPFRLMVFYAQTKQNSATSSFADSSFHVVYWMESLLDRLQRKSNQTK